jgi:DNA-binding transcriptional LysR family regulator
MNWDDLRILEAVRRDGTYANASARLRIDETTVARRLARLQDRLGVTLFELIDGERRATAQCDAIVRHVQVMAQQVVEIGTVAKRDTGPAGRFRIAATNSVAEVVLAPRTATFLAAHPGLTLHFLTSGDNVNFSNWEADLAIRLRKPDKGDFSISKLADVRLYLVEPIRPASDGLRLVCAYPDDLDTTPESMMLKERGLAQTARCVTDNVRIIRSMLERGKAVGILPEYLTNGLRADTRLRMTRLDRRREAWLLVQPHLKRNVAARLVIDFIRKSFANQMAGKTSSE